MVLFPESPVPLPSAEDLHFLREQMPRRLSRKNVSFYPSAGKLAGVEGDEAVAQRVRSLLETRTRDVQAFLQRAMPEFTRGWTVGTSSFRPLEERGRDLKAHASNERVHVDAGAYGATHGARVLRFFTNVNPTRDRVWTTKGDFAALFKRYGEEAGISAVRPLREGPLDKLRTGFLRTAERAGVPRASMADSSPYDRVMRIFHNFMKDSSAFQEDPEGHEEMRFAPLVSWMVLTDGISHACIEGQFAFVDTFLIPLANCRVKEAAPFHVLEGSTASTQARA